jgi:prefoldin beta subunit
MLQELDLLDEDAIVYKLIGPAMIKQDLVEAKTNVSKRLEYIQAEMKRIADRITTLEGKGKDQQALVRHQHNRTTVPAHTISSS